MSILHWKKNKQNNKQTTKTEHEKKEKHSILVSLCVNVCVCLTSTNTDTAAFTKTMRKSFTLHSNGTQTICNKVKKKKSLLTSLLGMYQRHTCGLHPNRLCVFLVYQMHILLLESCRWLEQGWTWWTSQKYIHSLQTAQTALGSDHVGGKKEKKNTNQQWRRQRIAQKRIF